MIVMTRKEKMTQTMWRILGDIHEYGFTVAEVQQILEKVFDEICKASIATANSESGAHF